MLVNKKDSVVQMILTEDFFKGTSEKRCSSVVIHTSSKKGQFAFPRCNVEYTGYVPCLCDHL